MCSDGGGDVGTCLNVNKYIWTIVMLSLSIVIGCHCHSS